MEVRYRWLNGWEATDEEWQRIDSILEARGWPSLNRPTTKIRIAEDSSGKLLGFLVLQLFPHTEPLWVAPSARASGVAEKLAEDMVAYLNEVKVRGFEVTADSPHAEKLAQGYRMRKVESPVYRAV